MILINPTRYIQLCKLAEQSRLEQAILHSWIQVLVLMVVMLTGLCVYLVLLAFDQREELKELKQILKQEPVCEKTAFDAVEMEKHNA